MYYHDVLPFPWKLRAGELSLCLASADVNLQPKLSPQTALASTVLVLRVSRQSHLLAQEGTEML